MDSRTDSIARRFGGWLWRWITVGSAKRQARMEAEAHEIEAYEARQAERLAAIRRDLPGLVDTTNEPPLSRMCQRPGWIELMESEGYGEGKGRAIKSKTD